MWWLCCILSNILLASLLASMAWFAQRLTRRPALARVLWLLVLLKLVTPPLFAVPLAAWSGEWACSLGVCACGPHSPAPTVALGALPWIALVVWSVGALATSLAASRRWMRFRRLTAGARPAPRRWQVLAARLASELSIRRTPEILAMPGRFPPLVVAGRRRARVLLPRDLMNRIDDSQRAALLLHELTHVKRGDHLVRMLELVVGVIYWWLPFVTAVGRRLRECEEACCDAAVVARRPQARRDYARLLLDVVDFTGRLPRGSVARVTAMSAAGDLERRLRAILDTDHRSGRSWPIGVLTVVLACAILPCGLRYEPAGRATVGPGSIEQPASFQPPARGAERPGRGERFSAACCPT